MRLLDELRQDLRYALRTVRQNPGFSAVVVITLALGSGANAAIFSIFNQALLRLLPVPAPERLVNLSSPGPKTGRTSTSSTFGPDDVFSYPLFRDLERELPSFTGIAAHRDFIAGVSYRDQATTEEGRLVSGSYFPVLGLQPALGRLLQPDDDRTGVIRPVVVLSHAYWRRRFNADPAVLNNSLLVNGQQLTIVGVAPRNFVGTTLENRPQIFVPLAMAALMMPGLRNPHDGSAWNGFVDRRDHWLYLFARLKPGVTLAVAERTVNIPFHAIINDVELPAQNQALSRTARERFKDRRLLLGTGGQGQRPEREELRGVLLLLFCVTGIVLLIACANITNLLLARAASRERDMTVRLSLGAGRLRIVRQVLTECALVAALGGVGGIVVASWTLAGLATLVPESARAMLQFDLDRSVLLFVVLISAAMTFSFGLYPALFSSRRDLASALKGGTSGTRSTARFRTALATAQIALSMVLLVLAGLFTKSLLNLRHVELGMTASGVTTFRLSPELNGYSSAQSSALFDRVERAVEGLPGVKAVTVSTIPILAGVGAGGNVTVEGFRPGPDTNTSSYASPVGPRYFETLGIPLVAGREFTGADVSGAPKVAIVNEAFAGKFELGSGAVGRHMRPGAGRAPDIEIVGLVKDARYSQPKDAPPPQYFLPVRQGEPVGALNFYVRSSGRPEPVLAALAVALKKIDPTVALENLRPLVDQMADTTTLDRLIGTLSSGFAALATLLAAVGLYGVLSYNVAQRTREIGLRMALGATVASVRRMVFGQVGWMTLVGGIVGAAAAVGLGRMTRSMLFEVPDYDVLVLLAAAISVVLVALAAGTIPAWRASRIEPMQALRCD